MITLSFLDVRTFSRPSQGFVCLAFFVAFSKWRLKVLSAMKSFPTYWRGKFLVMTLLNISTILSVAFHERVYTTKALNKYEASKNILTISHPHAMGVSWRGAAGNTSLRFFPVNAF